VNPLTRQLFDQVLQREGRTRETVMTIADRQGRVIYGVYKATAATVSGDSAIPECIPQVPYNFTGRCAIL
jgi:hypothetical protein